jgi:hypothetical protein
MVRSEQRMHQTLERRLIEIAALQLTVKISVAHAAI